MKVWDGSAWVAPAEVGKILQVVSTIETTNYASASTSYLDATNYEVSITPISASSTLLISYVLVHGNTGVFTNFFQLRRDSTDISEDNLVFIPTSGGGANSATTFAEVAGSTSARTYKIRAKTNGGILTIFNGSVVVMEVAS